MSLSASSSGFSGAQSTQPLLHFGPRMYCILHGAHRFFMAFTPSATLAQPCTFRQGAFLEERQENADGKPFSRAFIREAVSFRLFFPPVPSQKGTALLKPASPEKPRLDSGKARIIQNALISQKKLIDICEAACRALRSSRQVCRFQLHSPGIFPCQRSAEKNRS